MPGKIHSVYSFRFLSFNSFDPVFRLQYLRLIHIIPLDQGCSSKEMMIKGIIFLFFTLATFNGNGQDQAKFSIRGRLIDSVSDNAIPYASIELFSADKNQLVIGVVSGQGGVFNLDVISGNFYLVIESMGYRSF